MLPTQSISTRKGTRTFESMRPQATSYITSRYQSFCPRKFLTQRLTPGYHPGDCNVPLSLLICIIASDDLLSNRSLPRPGFFGKINKLIVRPEQFVHRNQRFPSGCGYDGLKAHQFRKLVQVRVDFNQVPVIFILGYRLFQ
jgi:hypothetical protein